MDDSGTPGLGHRLKQSRAFFFSLIAISAVWLVSSMSEPKVFREHYRLCFDGIDTARYAVTAIDSSLTLDIRSNGFQAFRRGLNRNKAIHIDVARKIDEKKADDIQLSLLTDEYTDIIRKQLDMRGVSDVKPVANMLHVKLAQRQSKAFVPEIDNVGFQFDAMVGLCGKPQVRPDTVYLYGSQASLDKIDAVRAEPQTIKNIRISGKYRVQLAKEWQKFPDVHPSTQTVDIYIPVETFTEKSVSVPVNYSTDKNYKRVQIYPASVTVKCLVPQNKYAAINSDNFSVTARLVSDSSNYLTPVVTSFPSDVRIKSISPQQLQFIIIK